MSRTASIAAVSVSASAALAWRLFGDRSEASPGWLLAKFLTVATLALLAVAVRRQVSGARLLAAALTLYAAGDVLLEWRFVFGLVAFLAGHVVFIALLWPHRRSLDDLGGGRKLALGSLAVVAALVLTALVPRLPSGPLALAVPLYVAVLALMAGSAFLASPAQPWLALGSSLFVTSDALLGLREFTGFDGVGAAAWPLYVVAQYCLSLGWLWGGPRVESDGWNTRDDRSV